MPLRINCWHISKFTGSLYTPPVSWLSDFFQCTFVHTSLSISIIVGMSPSISFRTTAGVSAIAECFLVSSVARNVEDVGGGTRLASLPSMAR